MLNQMTPEWNICARRAVSGAVCSLCHLCILLCPFPIYLVLELTLGYQSKLPIFPGDVLFGALGASLLPIDLSRAPKNSCLRTVVLEKTLESPLEGKDIKPVNLKGKQP